MEEPQLTAAEQIRIYVPGRNTMINPRDLMHTLSVEELCSTAETYYKSIPDPTPQMAKPFSSFLETPEILQNMGLLLSGLHLGKTMTVLDFGAGTCWFSRFLNQMQCQTISCDASQTALAIGKTLFETYPIVGEYISEPRFVHFNGHKIDLPATSVDRIICYDVFHHIPNQEEVISEFARVLIDGGIVGFSEPGRLHSLSPQSQYEMRNYNVLENDIDVNEIFRIARTKGFDNISFKMLGGLDLTLDEYNTLTSYVNQSDFDALKNSETKTKVLTNISQVMVDKTIFFLHKGHLIPDSRSHIGLSHTLSSEKNDYSIRVNENLNIKLRIKNTGNAVWLIGNAKGIGVVHMGTHLYDQNDQLLDLDFTRHEFASNVQPGETVDQSISVKISSKGTYRISIDLVSEAICWFENTGSQPQNIMVHVE